MAKLAGLENQARRNSHVGSNPTPSAMLEFVMRFFKLTLPKFITTSVLFGVFAAISPSLYRYIILDAHVRGLPMPFALIKDDCISGLVECSSTFFWWNLTIDLVFWYLVACVLFYLNDVIRKG